jgi:rhodanese-related sulfurtransferase
MGLNIDLAALLTNPMSPPVPRITPEEVKERLDLGEQILFIDTRNPKAWAESNEIIPGAVRMLASEVGNHVAELPKDRTIVTSCT